jgi:hypothetical protein
MGTGSDIVFSGNECANLKQITLSDHVRNKSSLTAVLCLISMAVYQEGVIPLLYEYIVGYSLLL